ncbi:MAG: GTPase HflX [Halobacteriovoraceae bacterium]|nr:GTPase HflX [Halobacteriovoraceae bacterium]MCB9095653.1 GTPase HflX [Halobacteriovoraceae bacterium]
MIDLEYNAGSADKAVLVSIITEKLEGHETPDETNRSLDELKELLRTLHVSALKSIYQRRKKIDPGTIIGSGKLEEIAEEARSVGANLIVFDFELSASQMRNITEITGFKILDRCQIILQIFAQHARSKEAKIQIEISRLNYLLPRLTSLWTHFTKQKGGIGLKGEGEQQLELDRRIVRKKIENYKKQLKEIEISRKERKKKRHKQSITAALVGYTNAGKSSLLNRLCQVETLEENKLFATLDSTYRTLTPDTKPPLILIDTVGFISNLPNTLIEGFKSTLESIKEADLILIVVDLSDPHLEKHIETTKKVLKELGLENKETFFVFNKKDKVENILMAKVKTRRFPNSYIISSHSDTDVLNLRNTIIDYFLDKQKHYDLFVPYERGDIHSKIQSFTNIAVTSHHEKGIYYRVRTPDHLFDKFGFKNYLLSPDESQKFYSSKN